jgi:hypothetical protein
MQAKCRDSAAATEGLLIFICRRFFHPRLVQIRHKSENPLSGVVTLAQIAEFLPYRFRSIAVAFEYGKSCGETSKAPRNTLNGVPEEGLQTPLLTLHSRFLDHLPDFVHFPSVF